MFIIIWIIFGCFVGPGWGFVLALISVMLLESTSKAQDGHVDPGFNVYEDFDEHSKSSKCTDCCNDH